MSVQVWQTARGAWRWRYVEPPPGHEDAGARAELENLDDHDTPDAAGRAARTAYPGVPVDVVPVPQERASASHRWTGRLVLAVVAVLALRRRRGSPDGGPRRV